MYIILVGLVCIFAQANSEIYLNSYQDITDFTQGCCFFANGGGGDPHFGAKMLMEALDQGKVIRIIDCKDIDPQAYTVCPFLMGSSGPDTVELKKARELYGLKEKTILNMSAEATKALLKHSHVELGAVIPMEVGGAATASAVATAAWLDVPVLDCDYSGGRSLPEISQMLPAIHGMKMTPLYSVDSYNNQACVLEATNAMMEERLGKMIASASFGLAGQAVLLTPFYKVQSRIQKGTLSQAYRLGKLLREARLRGDDIIQTLEKATDGQLICIGTISNKAVEKNENYYIGTITVNSLENLSVKIWFKNELMQLWVNDQPYITSPDFICVVSYPEGIPFLNNQLEIGSAVAIFAIPAPEILKSDQALKFLGPRYFGFDFDPITFTTRGK